MAFRPTARARLAAVAVACSAALGTSVALPAGALQAVPETGSAGIGDPYFPADGNGGYDVAHYDIHDTYAIGSGRLTGWTAVDAVATADLKSFNLDLVLAVDDVKLSVNGVDRPVDFAKDGKHELVVTPTGPLPEGTEFTVRVDYHGVPHDIGYDKNHPWISSSDEGLATNEPQIAPWWFPANDHPRDKATFDIEVKVPSTNEAVSNGELVSYAGRRHVGDVAVADDRADGAVPRVLRRRPVRDRRGRRPGPALLQRGEQAAAQGRP